MHPSMAAMSMLFSCVLMGLRLYSGHSFLVWLQGRSIMLLAKVLAKACLNEGSTTWYKHINIYIYIYKHIQATTTMYNHIQAITAAPWHDMVKY